MGTIYGFWRQLYKDQKLAKQRYIQMFYNLQFRNLVCKQNVEYEYNLFGYSSFLLDDYSFNY